MMKQKSYCIVCGNERDGIEVKEDNVLRALRYIKYDLFKRPRRNNRIVVCKSCYESYKKHRKRYIGRQRLYLALGVLFLIFSILLAPSIYAALVGIVMIALLYLLSLLNYMPELDLEKKKKGRSEERR